MENNIIKFKCPHCQNPLAFIRPANGYGVTITCPKCGKQLNIKIRDKAIRMPEQQPEQIRMAQLVIVENFVKQSFALHKGSNIIGRKDADTVQDINISGDMSISRRSVDLRVEVITGGGYSYILNVLNAKNPVRVNNTPLHTGKSMMLRPGDVIMLGNTKLMLTV